MGKFKHVAEKMRQALGMSAGSQKDWKPSSNQRNVAMVAEARKFALQLKALHADLSTLGKNISSSMVTMKAVLTAPLPRAYDESVVGVAPVDKEEHIVGANVNIDSISAAGTEMLQRLQAEVLQPLEQWLSAYRTIKDRNRKCETLRLDLDTKRRSLIALEERVEKLKAKGDKGDPKELEKLEYKRLTEHDKTVRATQRYAEVEAEVFNALLTLIRDTSVLREYAAAALLILERNFQLSYFAFDLNAPPVTPALPPPALPPPVPVLALPWSDGGNSTMTTSGGALNTARSTGGGNGAASARFSQGGPLQAAKPTSPPMSPPKEDAANPFMDQGALKPQALPTSVSQLPSPSRSPMPEKHTIKAPTAGDLAPPAWYTEAKLNSRPPTAYDIDSDDEESANPFKRDQRAGTKTASP